MWRDDLLRQSVLFPSDLGRISSPGRTEISKDTLVSPTPSLSDCGNNGLLKLEFPELSDARRKGLQAGTSLGVGGV